jgi:hypothetical protein
VRATVVVHPMKQVAEGLQVNASTAMIAVEVLHSWMAI